MCLFMLGCSLVMLILVAAIVDVHFRLHAHFRTQSLVLSWAGGDDVSGRLECSFLMLMSVRAIVDAHVRLV